MSNKKSWLNNKRKKNKDSYLKYEEGEVVPVESHRPGYPPFLNEKDDGVRNFKDVFQKEKIEDTPTPKQEDESFFPEFKNEKGNPNPKKPKWNFSIFKKLIWLMIIGGMVYYSIPIVQYFASESNRVEEKNIEKVTNEESKIDTSKLDKSVKDGVNKTKDTLEDIKSNTKETVDNITQKTDEVIGDVSQGSGLVDLTKGQLSTGNQESRENQERSGSLTDDQWLSLITNSQNQKQEILLELQNETSAYVNGHISKSRYRLSAKGLAQKAGRIERNLDENTKSIDTSQVDAVIFALQLELDHLQDMSITLSSLSTNSVPVIFNEEVDEQNRLTTEYKEAFMSLLDSFGKTYREESGVIIYN